MKPEHIIGVQSSSSQTLVAVKRGRNLPALELPLSFVHPPVFYLPLLSILSIPPSPWHSSQWHGEKMKNKWQAKMSHQMSKLDWARVNILAKNPNFSPFQIRKSRISSLFLSTGKYPNGRNLTSIGAKRQNFDIFVLIKGPIKWFKSSKNDKKQGRIWHNM